MIISRTPFRVSFAGGGTDLPSFYRRESGAVLSTSIDKYMYITVNKRFDHTIRVSYSKTEIVDTVDEIRHPLVREALKLLGVTNGVEITSISDIPSGTGLGSSSSFVVGLLHSLYAYLGTHVGADKLAAEACRIEIELVGEPIGKQDQYIAAYGGLEYIEFNPDESVFVDPVICTRDLREELDSRLMLFYTGAVRDARSILAQQRRDTPDKMEHLRRLRDLAGEIRKVLIEARNIDRMGEILHEAWLEKKKMSAKISSQRIDEIYGRARKAGALGGKILGAGGGGFLLLFAERQNQHRVREALEDLREVEFHLEPQGSKIIYVSGQY